MILGVIPARLNSTRFPSKVIFPLKGKPIIEHVYDKALQSDLLSKVIVAVDSEETKNATPRFKVGLGVMPDYLYNEGGMKISAITSDEKPAGKAGLQKNDIVIKMGDINVIDMMSYMNALSTFKEGDTTTIQIKRDGQIIDFTIKF